MEVRGNGFGRRALGCLYNGMCARSGRFIEVGFCGVVGLWLCWQGSVIVRVIPVSKAGVTGVGSSMVILGESVDLPVDRNV